MRKFKRPFIVYLIPLLFIFITGGTAELSAADYYLLPKVIARSESVSIGSFVTAFSSTGQTNSDVEPEKQLGRPLGIAIDAPAVISASLIKERMSREISESFVLVGRKCIFIPEKYGEPEHRRVWIKIMQFIADTDEVPQGWMEIKNDDEITAQIEGRDPDDISIHRGSEGTYTINDAEAVTVRFVPALRSMYRIQPGTILDKTQFTQVYVEESESDPLLPQLPLSSEIVASKYIGPGTVMHDSHVRKKEIIRSGERIVIVVERDPIVMKLEGIAYGSGGLGDTIKVKPVRSDRSLYGSIVSGGEVHVDDL